MLFDIDLSALDVVVAVAVGIAFWGIFLKVGLTRLARLNGTEPSLDDTSRRRLSIAAKVAGIRTLATASGLAAGVICAWFLG